MKFVLKTIRFLIWSAFAGICGLVLISASLYLYLSPALPDVQTLKDFKLQTPMRVMSADNKLVAEYGEKRRAPLRYEQIPTKFVQALVAIEDKRFEHHFGVDPIRFTRVVIDTLVTGDKEGPGGSTLTQQVARNYFLTQQKTFTRKFTEILLALKMESELSKQEIFELYINKHFLGYRSYGIQAASTVYYGKDINDLSLPELAMIAGLHQAPSSANPLANPERALKRRNTVLWFMRDNGFITDLEYQKSINAPLTAEFHGNNPDFEAYYLAEMVRAEMLERFGEDAYNDGYTIYTTINSELQKAADRGIRKTLIDYSRRHGYLGAEQHLKGEGFEPHSRLSSQLRQLNRIPTFGELTPALVLQGGLEGLTVIPKDSDEAVLLDMENIAWARERITVDEVGPEITHGYQVAVPGDVVRLEATDNGWVLAQIPRAQGALVALSPTDGSVAALVGGFDYVLNKYNRAVQASRQPGSNFKPFVYSAALDKGYTPATIVNDAPIVRQDATLEGVWRPKNSGDRYLGPIPLRQALYQSRNLSSIRVLDDIGIPYARQYSERFGYDPETLENNMTLILGATIMSPMQIAQGYAVFANGGYAVNPYFINRIEDKDGNILFEENPAVVCRGCPDAPTTLLNPIEETPTEGLDIQPFALNVDDESETIDELAQEKMYATQVLSPQTAFLMDSMLKDVVQRGTARAAKAALPRNDLAGKTGTTNDAVDAWFTGYNGDYVASTWVGYDSNTSLGAREYGGKAALPAWIEFMDTALKNKPENNLPQPVGIVQARIDPSTGLLANPGTDGARFEFFREDNVPTEFSNSTVTIDFSAEVTDSNADQTSESSDAGSVESLF
jgi:penicillin-binding protein 1A